MTVPLPLYRDRAVLPPDLAEVRRQPYVCDWCGEVAVAVARDTPANGSRAFPVCAKHADRIERGDTASPAFGGGSYGLVPLEALLKDPTS